MRSNRSAQPGTDAAGQRARAGLPRGANLGPLQLLVFVLALAVVAAGIFVAFAALQQPDDGTPRTAAERALADAKLAIKEDPRDMDARARLARVYIGMGRTESARETIEAALAIAPDDPRLMHLLGLALLEGGDAAAAIGSFEKAAEAEGGFAEDYALIWSDVGRARLTQDDVEGAAAAYEKALVYTPQAADVIYDLGGVYERLGRTDDAIGAYEGVLRFIPDHAEARAALARLRDSQ